jgi:photosystem II stability/assembly factor-like uncharacterized protein
MSRPSRFTRLALSLSLLSLPLPAIARAQAPTPPAPPAPLINLPDNPALGGFRWRSIGPVGQGGRVDDFAVDEKNPSTFYIGFAVGGVVKTVNNGTTFESIFDTYGAASIADLALAPSDPNILYVATGEANNRQTTSYGDGLYKSTDAGKTFTNVGFKDAQTLGRVIIHPRDPNTVWIAVGGHLYGSNAERGVFMTTDGGKTWNKTLYVDPNTSATELVIDPSNPNNLWAAMYQRQRTAWGFNGGGPGSGIYNSTDGGRTWRRVNAPGLPRGTMGRIALDIPKNFPNVIYAQIEVASDKEPPVVPAPGAAGVTGAGGGRGGRGAAASAAAAGATLGAGDSTANAGGGGGGRGRGNFPPDPTTSGVWRSNDKGRTWTFMSNTDQRPMYFSQIRVDPNNPEVVYTGGVGPTKSIDGGKTFNGLNNMGHVDNHAIWIDPLNSNHVMYGNDGAVDVTWDAGAKWESLRLWAVGLGYHASADMRHPYFVCVGLQDNGSWCGPSSVRDNSGIRQWMWQSVGGGDGFQNAIDPTDYNIFYTESQNAGINRYNNNIGETRSIKPTDGRGGRGGGGGGGGGAGAVAASEGVVTAPAGGRGGGRANILNPVPGAPIQFNWNSPIVLSPHSPSTIYLGGRSLFISRDRGNTWWSTKELGKGIDLNARQIMGVPYSQPACGRGMAGAACILSKNDGYVANEFGTMTEMAESPITPGVLWAGTDDGNVQISRDGGYSWEEVGRNIPGVNHEYYVSGLEASWYDAGTVYVALDGHRNDDLKPYIFKSTDYGKSWTSVTGNLPVMGNVNSIRQDPVNRNLLYAPTELGFFVSLDDGKTWNKFMPNLPIGRTDEVLVHPRDHDLILSTHSRSVWIMDDITPLQALTPDMLARDAALLPTRDVVAWKTDRRISTEIPGDKWWAGENAPQGTAIAYYLKNAGGDAKITITDAITNQEIRTQAAPSHAGLNRWQWNLCGNPPPAGQQGGFGGGGGGGRGGNPCQGARTAGVGTYRVVVNVGGKDIGSQTFRVLEDIWLNER